MVIFTRNIIKVKLGELKPFVFCFIKIPETSFHIYKFGGKKSVHIKTSIQCFYMLKTMQYLSAITIKIWHFNAHNLKYTFQQRRGLFKFKSFTVFFFKF